MTADAHAASGQVAGMRVAFRADASHDIGAGHIARCLALAAALEEQGASCHFICRAHPGHLGAKVESAGFELTLLPLVTPSNGVLGESFQIAWLGGDWEQDAAQTIAALEAQAPDWLVADHYAIDSRWEGLLVANCKNLAVIDDLADRKHDCDLLVDQNLGRVAADYGELVAGTAELLVGPRYALLRAEFARHRAASLDRRPRPKVERILVSMGGMDGPDATSGVLGALANCEFPSGLIVTVVLGENARWVEKVRNLAGTMPFRCEVLVGVTDMAGRMTESDLAIGAGGGTAWERCVLGLPSIVVSTAANQEGSARALAESGAIWHVGSCFGPEFPQRLQSAVRLALGDPDALAELGAAAAAICDGLGAGRVARRMLGSRLALREAGMDDAMLLHEWRNNPSTRQFFLEPSAVTVEGHLAWMERALAASDRVLLLAELDARPIGCVRFDIAGRDAEISIYMDPGLVGRGLGTMVIESAVRYARTDLGPEVLRLLARVKPENTKSLRAFRSAGFLPDQEMLVCEVRR